MDCMNTAAFTVFDVETPNYRNDRICSIGITLVDNGTVTDTKNILVDPECEYSAFNIRVHHIDKDVTNNCPAFPTIWQEIKELFLHRIVVAHNANFDLTVLRKTLAWYGLDEGTVTYLDTLSLSKEYFPNEGSHKLKALCESLHIPLEQHHNSECDSKATAELLLNLLNLGMNVQRNSLSASLHWDAQVMQEKASQKRAMRLSQETVSLSELREIVSDIIEDNQIDLEELAALTHWIEAHPELSGNYPYDALYSFLQEILEDGFVDSWELDGLLELCRKVVDPVGTSSCNDSISISGKRIVLSGEFHFGSKEAVEARLTSLGGEIQKAVTSKTNIVLVGGLGNAAWSSGNYGTKVKKAIELQAKGSNIKIVKEDDFWDNICTCADSESDAGFADSIKSADEETTPETEQLESRIKESISGASSFLTFIHVVENQSYLSVKAKNLLVATIRKMRAGIALELVGKYQDFFSAYSSVDAPGGNFRVFFNDYSALLDTAPILGKIAVEMMIDQSGEAFGCCSRYIECSDAKHCVHEDASFSMACYYRRNLEKGRIFYGKNKNC